MAIITIKKLNLPLPEKMHEALFAASRKAGVPATRLARSVLEDWLREYQREQRRAEVRQYAAEHANTEFDLDTELESAAIAELQSLDEEEDAAR